MTGELDWIAAALGAAEVRRADRIQALWGGYGELFRVELRGGPVRTAVVKWIRPRGAIDDRSHVRKCRSYEIETAWYRDFASRCDASCRVARLYAHLRQGADSVLVLEDLDAAGFASRKRRPAREALDVVLSWLAAFHARFLGVAPAGLWPVGSYWHLATRPDELSVTDDAALREAAPWLDARLEACTLRTLIHGDAKLANFCFTADGGGVAAVDFQYVGGGSGMRDVAYLLSGDAGSEQVEARHLDHYFARLRESVVASRGAAVDADALEREWRALYPVACLDFYRFIAGWAKPAWQADAVGQARARALLSRVDR